MKITVNKKAYEFEDGTTVINVLSKFEIPLQNGVAVAVNYSVVPKSELASTKLKSGDILEIIHATSGG